MEMQELISFNGNNVFVNSFLCVVVVVVVAVRSLSCD